MGHGNHWATVLRDVNRDLGYVLDAGVTKGAVIGRRRIPQWRGPQGVRPVEVSVIQNETNGFGCHGIVVADGSSGTYLHSAFPAASRGQIHDVELLRVSESSFGLEACITAAVGKATIRFFDPKYSLNAGEYEEGSHARLTLAGIAYHVAVPDPNDTVIHPEIGEVHLQGAAMLLPMGDSDSEIVSTDGFGVSYLLAGSDEPGQDDYSFRGVIKEAEGFSFLELPMWRFKIVAFRLDEGNRDVDLDLYVLDENIQEGHRPVVGGDVAGSLWLQGSLCSH